MKNHNNVAKMTTKEIRMNFRFQRNFLKDVLFGIIFMATTLFSSSCNKKEKDEKEVIFTIANTEEVVSVLNSTLETFSNSDIQTVVIDMSQLGRLEIGGAWTDLETAINAVVDASVRHDKAFRIILPEITVQGNARLLWTFYGATQGGRSHNTSQSPAGKSSGNAGAGGSKSFIVIEQNGHLHFAGGVPWNMLVNTNINALNEIIAHRKQSREEGVSLYPITADRVDINSSGLQVGAGAILDIIKPDTVNAVPTGALYSVRMGEIVDRNRLRSDRETPFTNASNVILEQGSHVQFRQVRYASMEGDKNPNSIMKFMEIPRVANGRGDTIDIGGDLGWARRWNESHFHYVSNPRYRFRFVDMLGEENFVINLPEHMHGVNDNLFEFFPDGAGGGDYRAKIDFMELTEFLAGRQFLRFEAYSNSVRFSNKAIMEVPDCPPRDVVPYFSGTAICWGELLRWGGLNVIYPGADLRIRDVANMQYRTR